MAGGTIGAGLGKLVKHREETGIERHIGERLLPGGASIIAVIGDDRRLCRRYQLLRSGADGLSAQSSGSLRLSA